MELIETLTFEQAMSELESIVRKMESGQLSLEESIQAFERGAALKNHCEQKLKAAKMKVDQIIVKEDNITLTPFDTAA